MKNILIAFMLICSLFVVNVRADEILIGDTSSGVKMLSPNLDGDMLYILDYGLAFGAGYTIASAYHNIFILRGEIAFTTEGDERNFYGAGVGINIPSLVKKLGGTWSMSTINAEIGILGMANFNSKVEVKPAAYLSIIKMKF